MPTLLNIGSFMFDDDAKNIPNNLKTAATTNSGISMIRQVLTEKFSMGRKYYDNIYLLDGRTGSGKSTLMITDMYKNITSKNNKSVLCVEPRIALAKSNATDICRYDSTLKIGQNVGVVTGNCKEYLKESGVCYCTSGILLNMIKESLETNVNTISQYQIVVIDEVHTLGIPEINMLMMLKVYLKKFEDTNKSLFMFTSATININMIVDYYFPPEDTNRVLADPYMIGHIKGAVSFPVKEFFKENDTVDIQKLYTNILLEAIYSKSTITVNNRVIPCRDILIFCHTTTAIKNVAIDIIKVVENNNMTYLHVDETVTYELLSKWRMENANKSRVSIIDYASTISSAAKTILESPVENDANVNYNEIRIIISTPVIESGKTISTLYACIDNGLHLKPIHNPLNMISASITNKLDNKSNNAISVLPIDMNMMTQRFGRVGREAPGIFYHNYTQNCLPYIKKMNISDFKLAYNITDYITSLCAVNTCIDIINKNVFIEPFSVETSIYTNYNMISMNISTLNGIYRENTTIITKLWLILAQYLYLISGYTLLDALMTASINRKFVTDNVYINETILKSIKPAKVMLSKGRITQSISEYITEAYNIYKTIKYTSNIVHYGLPYLSKK